MLSFTTKFGGLLSAALLAISLAGTAPAATLSYSVQPAIVGPSPLASDTSGTVIENSSAEAAGVRRSPWAPGSPNPFNSVSFGYAEYAFTVLQGAMSFVWGTPDRYNSVQFFRSGALIDMIPGFGNGKNIAKAQVLATSIGDGMGFDTVRFVSSAIAFEHAFIRFTPLAPIPVPAAGLLLLTAVGAVAALRRRKSA